MVELGGGKLCHRLRQHDGGLLGKLRLDDELDLFANHPAAGFKGDIKAQAVVLAVEATFGGESNYTVAAEGVLILPLPAHVKDERLGYTVEGKVSMELEVFGVAYLDAVAVEGHSRVV